MSRALFRSVRELGQLSIRPVVPKAQLPTLLAARGFNSTAPIVEPTPHPHIKNAPNPTAGEPRPLAFKKSHPTEPPRPIDDSVKTLLPLLAAQPGHYITIHIHGFPYLVQQGDEIRLPFRMPGVLPGDVIRLNRASIVGSRDFTLKGAPHIDERLFECRATVLGTEAEPLRIKIKTKRRQRRAKQAKSKHRYTILRVSELNIKESVESLEEATA
jgi:hypothetical protein